MDDYERTLADGEEEAPTDDHEEIPVDDYWEARRNYRRLERGRRSKLRRRIAKHAAEVKGNSVVVIEEICPSHGIHKMIVVRKNGDDISPPLCPVVVGLRRNAMDIREGKEPDTMLIARLLTETTDPNLWWIFL